MNIQPNTPRQEYTVAGHAVTIPAPFAEGHVCTAAEARALNQTLAENVRNNVSRQIADTATVESVQHSINEYVAKYEFGVRSGGGGGRTVDPVEREALRLATEAVRTALRKKGINLKDVAQADISARAKQAVQNMPQFRAEAKKNVDRQNKLAADELDLGDLVPSSE